MDAGRLSQQAGEYFIRKVYETDPLTCPKCQGEMWFDKLTTLRGPEGRIISFIDQLEVIKKILKHLSLITPIGGRCPGLPASQAQVDIMRLKCLRIFLI